MLIEDAIALICSPTTDGWGRLQQSRKTRSGLELTFSVHQSKRGKRVAGFVVLCRGVHEAKITNDDYGGMGIYPAITQLRANTQLVGPCCVGRALAIRRSRSLRFIGLTWKL